MASAGQWETVGKPKKAKGPAPTLSKSQKKTFVDRMPKLDKRDPIKEDTTIYEAFFAGENRNAVTNAGSGDAASKQRAAQAQANKKKKPEQNGKGGSGRPLSLEAALAQIEQAELESIVSQSQLRFPDNQDVWLKDLASYINLKLEKVVDSDPIFREKQKEFPQNQLSGACRQTINGVFKKCSKQSLDHVFYHCMQSMITDAIKGHPTLGYKVFMQMMAFHKPNIVLPKLDQYKDMIKTNENRSSVCLSVLWAVGQCGIADLRCGIKVWIELMMPFLRVRPVASYIVEYAEKLFVWHKQTQSAYGEVNIYKYFLILDTVFSPTLQGDLRKRLQAVYPEFKTIAYGANPSSSLRNFFANYLHRAVPNCSAALKQEVLLCLVLCLVTDKHCWSTWCQMYTNKLPQSGVLLQHFSENWELLSKQERNMLRETLRSFAITNDELVSQGKTSQDGFEICNVTTKELLQKMTHNHFPWGMLVFPILVVFAAIVAYDIGSSSNMRASKTVRFLEDYGVLNVLEQAWGRITAFVYLAMSWSEENFPRYCNWMKETVGPSLKQVWQSAVNLVSYLVDAATPHCNWAYNKTQQGLLWVYDRSPETWEQYRAWLWLSWDFVKDYTQWIWKHVLHWSLSTQHWIQNHVLTSVPTGNLSTHRIQETALWSVQQMHNYTLSFFSWCNQLLFKTE